MVKSSVRAWFISQLTGGLIYLFSEEVFSFVHALINIRNRKTIVIWIKFTLTIFLYFDKERRIPGKERRIPWRITVEMFG